MSIVQRLRLLFERNGVSSASDTNNNDDSHSPIAKSCFSSPQNNQSRKHSFFRSLQLGHSKCAYCTAIKKASGQNSRKAGAPPLCTSSTLTTVGMKNQFQEKNEENPEEDADDGSESDNSGCVIHEPNLRVNEGVQMYEHGRLPRNSQYNSRRGQRSKSHDSQIDTINESRKTSTCKESIVDSKLVESPHIIKVNIHSIDSSNRSANKESNDDVFVFSNLEKENGITINRGSPTKQSRRGKSMRVPVVTEMRDFVDLNDDEPDVQIREKSNTMDSKSRYHSVLIADVPYYQIYNQKALDRDMAQLYPKSDRHSNVRYQPRIAPLQAKRSMRKKRTVSSGAIIDDIVEEEDTRPKTLTSTKSLEDMACDLPYMDDGEEKGDFTKEATHPNQPESPTSRKAADGLLMQEISAASKPGGIRWAHMPQVIQSEQFKHLTEKQIQRQEALFEIITSEASYYRSLTVLLEAYVHTPEFNTKDYPETSILQRIDKHILFSNIEEICNTSERFFCALESRWLESPIMDDLCDIVRDFAHHDFSCFVTYLKNQHYQNNKYNELMKNTRFSQTVKRLQLQSACKTLPLDSFLLLPMQRVMRLQLLVKAVKKKTEPQSRHERSAEEALGALEQVLMACDREKNLMHKKQRIMEWCNRIDFRPSVKMVSLGDRQIVKLGDLGVVNVSKYGSSALKRSFLQMKLPITTVLLLDDYVLLTKKRKSGLETNGDATGSNSPNGVRYMVEAACLRTELLCHCATKRFLQAQQHQVEREPSRILNKKKVVRRSSFHEIRESRDSDEMSTVGPYFIHLILRPNTADQCDYQLDAFDYVNMERWLDAFASLNSDNKTFTDWVSENCIQAVVVRSYLAAEDDELDLKDGEIIVMLQTLPQGWSKGMTQDNRRGWFPSPRVTIIVNEAAKMRHEDVINPTRAYNDWVKKSSYLIDESEIDERVAPHDS